MFVPPSGRPSVQRNPRSFPFRKLLPPQTKGGARSTFLVLPPDDTLCVKRISRAIRHNPPNSGQLENLSIMKNAIAITILTALLVATTGCASTPAATKNTVKTQYVVPAPKPAPKPVFVQTPIPTASLVDIVVKKEAIVTTDAKAPSDEDRLESAVLANQATVADIGIGYRNLVKQRAANGTLKLSAESAKEIEEIADLLKIASGAFWEGSVPQTGNRRIQAVWDTVVYDVAISGNTVVLGVAKEQDVSTVLTLVYGGETSWSASFVMSDLLSPVLQFPADHLDKNIRKLVTAAVRGSAKAVKTAEAKAKTDAEAETQARIQTAKNEAMAKLVAARAREILIDEAARNLLAEQKSAAKNATATANADQGNDNK